MGMVWFGSCCELAGPGPSPLAWRGQVKEEGWLWLSRAGHGIFSQNGSATLVDAEAESCDKAGDRWDTRYVVAGAVHHGFLYGAVGGVWLRG